MTFCYVLENTISRKVKLPIPSEMSSNGFQKIPQNHQGRVHGTKGLGLLLTRPFDAKNGRDSPSEPFGDVWKEFVLKNTVYPLLHHRDVKMKR